MPKQTFFNLPESKRHHLLEAAEKEFARAPLSEASIANIVKEACIARGSFYQYFEDKEDAYFFLLNQQMKELNMRFISILKENNGDIIDAMIEMYHEFLIVLPDENEHDFFKNALLNVTHKMENSFTSIFEGNHSSEHMKEVTKLINVDCLNISDEKDIIYIIKIVAAVAFRNFVEKYSGALSDEEAINIFKMEMNLLKNGLYKKK
ncbi:TetR/AcrR family transcriptional regulator [Oceanobacillus chungangensis]|uniref:TetR/AcrR family transcriptional regulator n=1 Tax=Oceanobacillus chungangensis TaxID=1229152 RepID=A0A3D8PN02_9BACI|nr:TetR/AcrR family transcriptional regulator [Oceanobacillus chungangensis]RDW16618.1 TetR/AcrR family transcriptional regulator [Oceanobacillus chungangensis]